MNIEVFFYPIFEEIQQKNSIFVL